MRISYNGAILNSLNLLFIFLLLQSHVYSQTNADFRNFYGISWRGTPHENLKYAKQMGYDCVFYQPGMEKDSLSDNLLFYLETPENFIFDRTIQISKKYDRKAVEFYEEYCALSNFSFEFPNNLATGWFFNDTTFCAQLDFRKQYVVSWAIEEIMKTVSEIESRNPSFNFAGLAWDVPDLTGDFWNGPQRHHSKGVKGRTNLVAGNITYSQGRALFYLQLFERVKAKYPRAKFIMEPYDIYQNWLKVVDVRNMKVLPDMLCQESKGLNFITDPRIYKNFKRVNLASTTPEVFSENGNRIIAGTAAKYGAWFSWYGRFGGTGDMPDYKTIKEVPFRLKLIRLLPNWENLNHTNLTDRHWDGINYKSRTAIATSKIIALRKPNSNYVYIVFLSNLGRYQIPTGKGINGVYSTDSLFSKSALTNNELSMVGDFISVRKNHAIGKGFIIELK